MSKVNSAFIAAMGILTLALPLATAGDAAPPAKKNPPRWVQMDYGNFLSASILSDPKGKFIQSNGHFENTDVAPRGIAVKLSDDWMDGIVFDCDTLRYSAAWNGGALKLLGVPFDGAHGPGPTLSVPPTFTTPHCPGWADKGGSFTDPRKDNIKPLPPPGPIPAEWGKYKGLYRNGKNTVFSYSIGNCDVLDMPGFEVNPDVFKNAFTRSLTLGASAGDLALMVAEVKGAAGTADGATATLGSLKFALVNAPAGAKFEASGDQIRLKIPAPKALTNLKIIIAKGDAAAIAKDSAAPVDLNTLTKGGPAAWTEKIVTQGVVSSAQDAYVVDTITIPYDNPYKAWMRIGGFDFFPDNKTAAVSTWSGDIWLVKNIDDKLENVEWKRFATGLHQPLGVKIVDGKIYAVGKDQITRFHDLNGDEEADFYECFNHDWQLTTAFHSFCYDLQTDAQGNFYFIFGAPVRNGGRGFQALTDHHGTLLKISKDGSKTEVYATGFRSPNGIGISPDGQLTSSDNEGTWVPATPLHWIKQGSFNGVCDTAHEKEKHQPMPLCFMPKNVDNSGGGQVWVTTDKWGPFKGELLHLSYGQSTLYKVLKETVNNQVQGGVAKIPVKFASSAMRGRFNPGDGQLYVSGLKGWQTNAGKDGGFDRVRYTGKPVNMPTGLNVTDKGVKITFTGSIDSEAARDLQNYACEVWNYKWTENYGSGQFSTLPADPNAPAKKGDVHDPMTIKNATLVDDGKAVLLEIENMRPVMQMKITYKLKASDGTPVSGDIHNTIHNLGK